MSTTDKICVIRQTLQKMWEFNKDVYIYLFVDFKEAYLILKILSIRASTNNILKEFKFRKTLINLYKWNRD